jgi:hypothetical protein
MTECPRFFPPPPPKKRKKRKIFIKKIVHYIPDSVVQYKPKSIVHYIPEYSLNKVIVGSAMTVFCNSYIHRLLFMHQI